MSHRPRNDRTEIVTAIKDEPGTRIFLSPPHMGGEELNYVQEAFAANWIAPAGSHLQAFEGDLCAYTGVGHAAALASGTAAIHLGLKLLGVGEGDEVICQSFTFSGSANPIVYEKAVPVFVDSEEATWNLDPGLLEEAIKDRVSRGKRPKAVIAVHLYGMPARMREIGEVCATYGVPVLEDAAEALGSRIDGRPAGSFGKVAVLSFNGNKIITTSGGGALLSNDREIVERARYLATQARDPAPHYEHSTIGYNYRLSNVLAGIGRGQMQVLEQRVAQRRKNFEFYRKRLGEIEGIFFLEEPEGYTSNRWLTTMLVDSGKTGGVTCDDLRLALDEEDIEARPLWKPMHLQPVFEDCPFYGNGVSEGLFQKGLCLPSGSSLSEADLERICGILMKTLELKASGAGNR